jgi:hypothetical protein
MSYFTVWAHKKPMPLSAASMFADGNFELDFRRSYFLEGNEMTWHAGLGIIVGILALYTFSIWEQKHMQKEYMRGYKDGQKSILENEYYAERLKP